MPICLDAVLIYNYDADSSSNQPIFFGLIDSQKLSPELHHCFYGSRHSSQDIYTLNVNEYSKLINSFPLQNEVDNLGQSPYIYVNQLQEISSGQNVAEHSNLQSNQIKQNSMLDLNVNSIQQNNNDFNLDGNGPSPSSISVQNDELDNFETHSNSQPNSIQQSNVGTGANGNFQAGITQQSHINNTIGSKFPSSISQPEISTGPYSPKPNSKESPFEIYSNLQQNVILDPGIQTNFHLNNENSSSGSYRFGGNSNAVPQSASLEKNFNVGFNWDNGQHSGGTFSPALTSNAVQENSGKVGLEHKSNGGQQSFGGYGLPLYSNVSHHNSGSSSLAFNSNDNDNSNSGQQNNGKLGLNYILNSGQPSRSNYGPGFNSNTRDREQNSDNLGFGIHPIEVQKNSENIVYQNVDNFANAIHSNAGQYGSGFLSRGNNSSTAQQNNGIFGMGIYSDEEYKENSNVKKQKSGHRDVSDTKQQSADSFAFDDDSNTDQQNSNIVGIGVNSNAEVKHGDNSGNQTENNLKLGKNSKAVYQLGNNSELKVNAESKKRSNDSLSTGANSNSQQSGDHTLDTSSYSGLNAKHKSSIFSSSGVRANAASQSSIGSLFDGKLNIDLGSKLQLGRFGKLGSSFGVNFGADGRLNTNLVNNSSRSKQQPHENDSDSRPIGTRRLNSNTQSGITQGEFQIANLQLPAGLAHNNAFNQLQQIPRDINKQRIGRGNADQRNVIIENLSRRQNSNVPSGVKQTGYGNSKLDIDQRGYISSSQLPNQLLNNKNAFGQGYFTIKQKGGDTQSSQSSNLENGIGQTGYGNYYSQNVVVQQRSHRGSREQQITDSLSPTHY